MGYWDIGILGVFGYWDIGILGNIGKFKYWNNSIIKLIVSRVFFRPQVVTTAWFAFNA